MFRPATSPPHIATLILMAAVPILTLNMFLPALATVADEFGVSYGTAALSISLYMVATAVLQLVVGPLSDRYGRRPVILGSVVIFTLASVGCAVADSFAAFMAWRVVQAAVITTNALGRAIVRDVSPPQEAAARLGVIGSVMSLGPMLAPLAGGLLLAAFGWRMNFVLFAGLGLLLFWVIWADAGETAPKTAKGWRAQVAGYRLLLRDGPFWSYTACASLSVGIFFAYITGVPLVVERQFGLSPVVAGAAMGAPPVGFMLGNIVSARIATRFPLARLMLAGRVITVIGLGLAAALWSTGLLPPLGLVAMMMTIGIGNGITLPTAYAGAMSVRADLTGAAAGLSGAVMLLAAGALSWAVGWVMGVTSGGANVLLVVLLATAMGSLLAGLPALRAEDREAVRSA